ncbi:hypothetical protein B0H34DRAFT_650233 [Crassisporium funariophilum]|nr:hypothetical protein B0H34DRAFT_650233 [Crassisporium funariophilum]
MAAPAAVSSLAPVSSDPTTDPTLDPTATDAPLPDDPTATAVVPAAPSVAANATAVDPAAPSVATNATTVDPSVASNTTVPTNSTTSRRSTRFWARHLSFDEGSDIESSVESSVESSFVEESSVTTFEESISTFVETWEDLCLVSGGDIFTHDPCTSLAGFGGIDALLETADACDQHDIADSMITFAKSKGIKNRDSLINFALSYRRHPRHSVKILGVIPSSLYCLKAPVNEELNGVYNSQFEGASRGIFGSPNTPMVPFGSTGTCPFGMTADVSSCGCVSNDSIDTTGDAPTTTDDSSIPTDDSTDSTDSTDASTDSTDTSTDGTDTSTDAATATDSASVADATDSSDATSTDSADLTSPTDASATASTDDSASATADASNAAATAGASGVNVQPADISGNVNDPNGR